MMGIWIKWANRNFGCACVWERGVVCFFPPSCNGIGVPLTHQDLHQCGGWTTADVCDGWPFSRKNTASNTASFVPFRYKWLNRVFISVHTHFGSAVNNRASHACQCDKTVCVSLNPDPHHHWHPLKRSKVLQNSSRRCPEVLRDHVKLSHALWVSVQLFMFKH